MEERSAKFSRLLYGRCPSPPSICRQPASFKQPPRSPRINSIPGCQAKELGLAMESLERRQKADGHDGAARLRREIQDSEANLQRKIEEVLQAIREEGVLTGDHRDNSLPWTLKAKSRQRRLRWIDILKEYVPEQVMAHKPLRRSRILRWLSDRTNRVSRYAHQTFAGWKKYRETSFGRGRAV